ncbi:MAG: winged helix-turn-helix transcriptional regulator [Rhodobacteraceae bacterium]|nr:winged helix-turn-helix transcriptional regulator [Paracoccaceae bacterium]
MDQDSVIAEAEDTLPPPAPPETDVAPVARALGHPARIRIVAYLRDHGPAIAGDIVEAVGLAQSTVSEHLRLLREAGIVTARSDPPRVIYALDPDSVVPLARFLISVMEMREG